MVSKIDYANCSDGKTLMYVNLNRFNSSSQNWVSLESLFQTSDFIDLLSSKLTGKKLERYERELLLKTLLLVGMGVGHEPPSVFVPKVISSTTKDKRFSVINGLIGGLATFGTHHLGAVYDVMQMYFEIVDKDKRKYVEDKIKDGEIIFGFGHPVFREDPRSKLLLDEIDKGFARNKYRKSYAQLEEILREEKNLYSNIDAVTGLSYVCLGFQPEHGIYLSFLARSLSMVCHIEEEQGEKPFSFFLENSKAENNKN